MNAIQSKPPACKKFSTLSNDLVVVLDSLCEAQVNSSGLPALKPASNGEAKAATRNKSLITKERNKKILTASNLHGEIYEEISVT